MKAFAILLAGLVTPSFGQGEDGLRAQCLKKCSEPLEAPRLCEKFKTKRPASLQGICIEQYRNGAAYGCNLACDGLCGESRTPAALARKEEACKGYVNQMPRPLLADTCKSSFSMGAETRCSEMSSWLNIQKAALLAAQEKDLVTASVDASASVFVEPVVVEAPVEVPAAVERPPAEEHSLRGAVAVPAAEAAAEDAAAPADVAAPEVAAEAPAVEAAAPEAAPAEVPAPAAEEAPAAEAEAPLALPVPEDVPAAVPAPEVAAEEVPAAAVETAAEEVDVPEVAIPEVVAPEVVAEEAVPAAAASEEPVAASSI